MNVIVFIGFIMFAVAVANMIQQRLFRKISVNYIAMLIGMAIALIPQTNQMIEGFSSEIFMGVIVAPLLFFEGQRTRLYNVVRSWRANRGHDHFGYDNRRLWHLFKYWCLAAFILYFGGDFYANRCDCNRISGSWT